MVFNKTSKFDYEARVLLGLVAFEYCKMTAEEGRSYLEKSLKRLEKRLPDISPKHEKRKINEEGLEPVRRWWNVRILFCSSSSPADFASFRISKHGLQQSLAKCASC